MTPAACSMLALFDPWATMLLHLAGEPPPPLPGAPGRRYRSPPASDADPYADAWTARHALPADNEGAEAD